MHEVVQEYITTMYSETAKKADMLPLKTMLLTRMKENYLSIMDERVQYELFYQKGAPKNNQGNKEILLLGSNNLKKE